MYISPVDSEAAHLTRPCSDMFGTMFPFSPWGFQGQDSPPKNSSNTQLVRIGIKENCPPESLGLVRPQNPHVAICCITLQAC